MRKNAVLFSALYVGAAAVLAFRIYVFSSNIDLKTESEIHQHVGIAAAALVGGLWASYRFLIQRGYETALQINFQIQHFAYEPGRYIVFADAILTNNEKARKRKEDNCRSKTGKEK
jgi:hypothetical protein